MIQTLVALMVVLLIILVFISVRQGEKDTREKLIIKAQEYLAEADELELIKRERIIVAGIEYRKENARVAIKGLKEGDTVNLVREPENPHDNHAVKVCVKGIHVGYIPRYLSKEIFDNFSRILYIEVADALDFTKIPALYLNIGYKKKRGLSDEAVNFFNEHGQLLNSNE